VSLIAVIQAIASASLQESKGREAFFSRLHALAAAQDLIISAPRSPSNPNPSEAALGPGPAIPG
jgi:hypothetical protein